MGDIPKLQFLDKAADLEPGLVDYGHLAGKHFVGAMSECGKTALSPFFDTFAEAHLWRLNENIDNPRPGRHLICYRRPTIEEQRETLRLQMAHDALDVEVFTVVIKQRDDQGRMIYNSNLSPDFLDLERAKAALLEIRLTSHPDASLQKATIFFNADELEERSALLRRIYRRLWRPVLTPWTRPRNGPVAVHHRQARQMRDPRVPRKSLRKEETPIRVLDMKSRLGLGFGAMFTAISRKRRRA